MRSRKGITTDGSFCDLVCGLFVAGLYRFVAWSLLEDPRDFVRSTSAKLKEEKARQEQAMERGEAVSDDDEKWVVQTTKLLDDVRGIIRLAAPKYKRT